SPLNVNKFDNSVQYYHHRWTTQLLTKDDFINKEMVASTLSIQIDANSFVGPLISYNAIKKVGLPRKDFFIWDDDAEYTYRISRIFPCYVFTNCIIYHKDINPTQKKIETLWKYFYFLR